MKMQLSFLGLLLFFLPLELFSQSYEQYEWVKDREITVLNTEEAGESELQILQHVQYEYVIEKNNPVIYFTRHEIVRVNNDKAVAGNNRIYIPMWRVVELLDVRARTILADGRVVNIDKKDIKEIEDEEAGAGYKIFAIDGAEVGSEIEYYYTCKMAASFFGREYFQSETPAKLASLTLISPANLEFEFKSYNGFPDVVQNEKIEGKNVYEAIAQNVPGLKKEEFSVYNNHRKRVEFMLAYKNLNGYAKLFSWEKAGNNIYASVHKLEKSEGRQIDKILKAIKVDRYETNYLKAAAIEDYVKTKFYINNNASEGDNIEFIAKNKFGNKFGFTRLTVALLEKANIPVELVLTTNRRNLKMDGQFHSYNYLEDYLIYLPKEKKYIAPYHIPFRLDLTPPEFTANEGLFISAMKVRDYVHPVSQIKYIAPAKAAENFDNMLIGVAFDEGFSSNTIRLNRSFKGTQASGIKSILPVLEEEKKQELMKELVKFMTSDSDILELKFEKTEFDFKSYQDPLVLDSKFKTSAFVERAGPTLLFKVGELIGPQSELYQEKKRMLPVENDFNRSYSRSISLTIPEGYEIQNLKDIIIKEDAKNEKGEIVYSFVSDYKLEGNQLKVDIEEFYEDIYCPLEKFEDFRRVINAAADFNKVVLVMKKI